MSFRYRQSRPTVAYRAGMIEGGSSIMAEKRLFLGVKRSVTGLCWEHRLNERQEMTALAIAQGHGVSDIVARVLAGRG